MPDIREIEAFAKQFVTEGSGATLEKERPFAPAAGLAASRAESRADMGRLAKFAYDRVGASAANMPARLAPDLPPFARDIERVPDYAKAAASGIVSGATFGAVDIPIEDETTGMFMVRAGGNLIGNAITFGATNAAASAVGLASRASRLAFGLGVGTEIALTRRLVEDENEASALRDVIDIGLMGVLVAFGGPKQAADLVKPFMMREPAALTTRYRDLGGGLKLQNAENQLQARFLRTIKDPTKVVVDQDELEILKQFQSIIKNTPRGEINFAQLRDLGIRAAKGEKVGNNITIDYVDVPHLYEMVRGRLSPRELEEFFGREAKFSSVFRGADTKLPSIKTGITLSEAGETAAIRAPGVEIAGRPELGGASPESRLRALNAELKTRLGASATADTRASTVVDDLASELRGTPNTAEEMAKVQDAAAGAASKPLRGTIKTPSGQILTEAEALARRGRPARAPVDPATVQADVLNKGPGLRTVVYRNRANQQKAGSVTYVKLRPEGERVSFADIETIASGPDLGKLRMRRQFRPIRIGEEAEYMILEMNPAPGFSDFIVRDLRGRGIRFIETDPTSTHGKNIRGLLKRHGGEYVEGTDIIRLENLHSIRGGAPGEIRESTGEITSELAKILESGMPDRTRGRALTMAAWRPTKHIVTDLERADGLPYYQVFEATMQAQETAREAAYLTGKQVFDRVRQFHGAKRTQALDYLVGTAEQRAAAKLLDPSDIASLDELKTQVLNPHWGKWFGTSFDDYAENAVRPFRITGVNDPKLVNLPKRFNTVAGNAETGRLNLVERDLARFLNQHIHVGAQDIHYAPTLREASKFINTPGMPKDSRHWMANLLRGTDGHEGMFLNRVVAPVYQGFWKMLGRDVPASDARNFVTTMNALTHAGLLGFRPAPLLRNLFGGIQTGAPRIGTRWYYEGQKQALTAKGQALFQQSGIPQEAATIIDKLDELASSTPTRYAVTAAHRMMKPYGRVDLIPRAAAYLGGRARLLNAAKHLGANAPEEQVFKAVGLWRFHPVIRREVLTLYRKGLFEDAGRLYGSHVQQDSQWVYRTGYRPELLRGEAGRMLGTFGVWPLNYMEYLKQMVSMPETPAIEKLKWITEWALVNSAIVGTFAGVGASVGLGTAAANHTLGWTFFGPAAYGGAPSLEAMQALGGLWHELAVQRDPGRSAAQAIQAVENLIPGSQLLRDIEKSGGPKLMPPPFPRKGGTQRTYVRGRGYRRTVKTEEPKSVAEAAFRFATGVQRRPQ